VTHDPIRKSKNEIAAAQQYELADFC